jgi:putative FmdB family regulatory protein
MPTYEFRCPLGHEFEKFYRSIGVAEGTAACPVCGQIAERMMSAGAGLVFKGSGFYLTDYGKNAHRGTSEAKPDGGKGGEGGSSDGAKAEGAKSESGGGESSGESKSESKGESKAEPKAAVPKPAPPPKPSSGE